eukprot:scaffold11481_cov109-Skeletonema_menzelii.AAC.1
MGPRPSRSLYLLLGAASSAPGPAIGWKMRAEGWRISWSRLPSSQRVRLSMLKALEVLLIRGSFIKI